MHIITISDPDGLPAGLARDLDREDAIESNRSIISYDESADIVTVGAEDNATLKWLYNWLEDSVEYYRENFDAASGEIDAARQLADRVYTEVGNGADR